MTKELKEITNTKTTKEMMQEYDNLLKDTNDAIAEIGNVAEMLLKNPEILNNQDELDKYEKYFLKLNELEEKRKETLDPLLDSIK